eukprot:COSAG02_NODE_6741_length_3391_cov_6.722661_1_plen_293_part_10
MALSIDEFKGLSVASTWAVAVIGLCVPLCLYRRKHPDPDPGNRTCLAAVLSTLNSLSAGVFLTAGLMHLLVDAIENHELEELSLGFWGNESLHAISLCCIGFVLLVGIEQLAHACSEQAAPHDNEHGSDPGHGHDGVLTKHLLGSNAGDVNVDLIHTESVQSAASGKPLLAACFVSLALSFHSVIEGLALGAQTDTDHALGILIAVLGHKALESCALGNMLLHATQTATRCRQLTVVTYLGLFSLLTPAGIAIAWLLTHEHDRRRLDEAHDHGSVWTAIFSGLGAGTFMYISA